MNLVKAVKLTLLASSLVLTLLASSLPVYAAATDSRGGGGAIIVFDGVDAVVVKPVTTGATVADDVIVDGHIITAEDGATASPAGSSAFSGRLLTAADLRADQ